MLLSIDVDMQEWVSLCSMVKIPALRGRVKELGVIWSVRWVLGGTIEHLTGHPRFCKVRRLEGNHPFFDN